MNKKDKVPPSLPPVFDVTGAGPHRIQETANVGGSFVVGSPSLQGGRTQTLTEPSDSVTVTEPVVKLTRG